MKKTIEIEVNNIEVEAEDNTFSFDYKITINNKVWTRNTYTSDFSWYKTAGEFRKILIDWRAYELALNEMQS